MKKIALIFTAVCLCLLMCLTFTACFAGPSAETPVTNVPGGDNSGGEHEHVYIDSWYTKDPTCTREGVMQKFCGCGYTVSVEVDPLPHTEETMPGKAPTCVNDGFTESKRCTVCGVTTVEYETIPAQHTEQIVEGYEPTCTEEGLTEGSVCSVCGITVIAQKVLAPQHTEETVKGYEPTCTKTGLSDGVICSVCGVAVIEQKILTLPHTEETVKGYKPTCTEEGLSDGKACSICGTVTVEQEVIPPEHSEITVLGKESTCSETGLTDGKKCSVCGIVTVEQEIITQLKSHNYVNRYCTECNALHASEGLEYQLWFDDTYYVTGIGTCTDTDIYIPNTYNGIPVTLIGGKAFASNINITSVTVENGVESIGSRAFDHCTSLKSVMLPESITSIRNNAFVGCTATIYCKAAKDAVEIDWGNDGFPIIWDYEKSGVTDDGFAWASTEAHPEQAIIYGYSGDKTEIAIPAKINDMIVTEICNYAFSKREDLTSISLPDSIKLIDNFAFYRCTGLTEIVIPNGVTTIGGSAFSRCTGLTEIVIPNSVTNIGQCAFAHCTGLTSIIIPDSVTTISSWVFISINADFTIYCEAESKPENWHEDWNTRYDTINSSRYTVIWGYEE